MACVSARSVFGCEIVIVSAGLRRMRYSVSDPRYVTMSTVPWMRLSRPIAGDPSAIFSGRIASSVEAASPPATLISSPPSVTKRPDEASRPLRKFDLPMKSATNALAGRS